MTTSTQVSAREITVATRPEVELLLCCARTYLAPETAARIRTLLQEDIDWAYLIQKANQHGAIPLLYCSLKTTCLEAVPNTVLNQLQSHFHTNAVWNWYLTEELLKLLKLFEAHGISAIPYKGPALATMIYGNLALREFSDLDILVHEQDAIRATDLLISQGYQPPLQLAMEQARPYLQSEQFRESAQYHGSYNIVRNDSKVIVELHWKLTHKPFRFPLAADDLWKELKPISLAKTTVLQFSPENLLLILCMHGTKDLWTQLKWICDIAELIRVHQNMNWERVLGQASKLGSRRMLLLGLLLANMLLETALPELILHEMQADSTVKSLAVQVRTQLFDQTDDPFAEGQDGFIFHLRARERLQDKFHFLFNQMTTLSERDWEFLPLPAYLYSLYYLLRPIRLLGKFGLSLLRSIGFYRLMRGSF